MPIPLVAVVRAAPLLGLAVGAGLFVFGVVLLQRLVRRGVGWWPSVAAPLLTWGPAVGILVGAVLAGQTVAFGQATWAVHLAWSLLAFFGVTALVGLAVRFLRSHVVTEELGLRVPDLLLDGARYLVWLTMLFVVVGVIWGRTEYFSALFTASAVGTVILGFALQETLANFFAGMSLLTERIYGIGDWVWIGDLEGQVVKVTRRSTQLRTRTGDHVTMSNRNVAQSTVRNVSRAQPAHAELLRLSAPYDAPPNEVRAVLKEAALACPAVARTPEPRIRLRAYGDSGIEYELRVAIGDVSMLPDVRSEIFALVWYGFQRRGISFPYPVREHRRWRPGTQDEALEAEGVDARLAGVPVLGALPPALRTVLARGAEVVTYGAGERVVEEGQQGDASFVVDRGRVAVVVSEAGADRRVAELGPGELFGEMSLLTGERRAATVVALQDTRLVRVGAEAMRRVLEEAPDVAERLAEAVVRRREGLTEARASRDADADARVRREAMRLGAAIRRFFRVGRGS